MQFCCYFILLPALPMSRPTAKPCASLREQYMLTLGGSEDQQHSVEWSYQSTSKLSGWSRILQRRQGFLSRMSQLDWTILLTTPDVAYRSANYCIICVIHCCTFTIMRCDYYCTYNTYVYSILSLVPHRDNGADLCC